MLPVTLAWPLARGVAGFVFMAGTKVVSSWLQPPIASIREEMPRKKVIAMPTTAPAAPPAQAGKKQPPPFRILVSHCQSRPEEIDSETAHQRLAGYYPDVKKALNALWKGERLRTMGHEWWIEKYIDGEWVTPAEKEPIWPGSL